jgi:short-subunit dehydrogenase
VLAASLERDFGVHTEVVVLDLGDTEAVEQLASATVGKEIGLVVANAASVPIGPFADASPGALDLAIAVNCATTVRLARTFLPPMTERRRGGMVIVSSMAGMQGTPMLSTYAATKSFGLVLAEGLWHEFGPHGVDVIACAAGAVADPNLAAVKTRRAPGTLPPHRVASQSLDALGRGPRVVPGRINVIASVLMGRLLPRRIAVRIMARNTSDLRQPG